MNVKNRFLKYVKIHSTSDDKSTTVPTTKRQLDFANVLYKELEDLGLSDIRITKEGYVYGVLPATKGYEDKKTIGFISHMDTAPDASGENVNPQVIENYDGNDINLPNGLVISKQLFSHLEALKGRTIITTDGTTLLGADDKAGIAEILSACAFIIENDIPHCKICVGFTPDEEVGAGADYFDVKNFGCDYAYTIDGGQEGELEYESFNAASAKVTIKGFSVHTGSAKDTMINAGNVAIEFMNMLPRFEVPEHTKGYEGFFHLDEIKGTVSEAYLEILIRDHDKNLFNGRKETIKHITNILNEKYGENTVVLELKDYYYNMGEIIENCFEVVEIAKQAMENLDIKPLIAPIRGGTDGARLSFMGLPCPNIGTGGFAAHGPYEHISVEGMEATRDIIVEIIKLYSK